MKKRSFIFSMLLICAFVSQGQEHIRDILSNARSFELAVEQAEAYFSTKHPGFSPAQLSQGEHRDGEYVKFKRWEAWWKEHLNEDGSLGDPSAYFREIQDTRTASGPFDDIEWTNLSYENYLDRQIGMGRTTSIGFHPEDINTFYVGAAIGGVWKTADGGQSYEAVGDDLPFLAVSAIVVSADDPDEVYIALSDHVWYGPPSIGVYKSINGGATWEETALSFEFSENIRIYWMIAAPDDPDTIFVGTADGLFRTTDGFETVSQINPFDTRDVKFHPGDPSIVYQGRNNGSFYRSTDGGSNFSLVGTVGSDPVMIAVTPLDENKVYTRSGNSLRKSFDAGQSFESTSEQLPDNGSMLMFSPADDEVLLSGWFDVWRSDNGGSDFNQITHWLNDGDLPDIHVDQRNVFINPLDNQHIYFCNDGGVYKYHVENNEFTNLCNGLMITQFYDIAVSQTDAGIIGGGSQDNGNVFRNSEGEWEFYAGTGDGMNQEIDPTNENVRYWSYQLGSMQRYVSGNNTGIAPPGQSGNGAWETPYKLDQQFPDRIVCAYNRVYESWTQGNSWEDISGILDGGSNMEQLAIAPSNSNVIYVARGGSLWARNPLSGEWLEHSLPLNGPSDLEVDPVDFNTLYITIPGYSDGNKVFRSSDAGETWENISGSLPNVSTGAIETYTPVAGGLFVGTDAGVYYRDDTFDDWQLYGSIPHTRVEDIEIQYAEGLVRIGTHGRGVLEAPVNIGLCEGAGDADADGICDEYDSCPGFDDALLGTPCNDGNGNTIDDIYIDCDLCQGILDVSVGEGDAVRLKVFPNPSEGIFQVGTTGLVGGSISVMNPAGQLIIQQEIFSDQTSLDLGACAKGLYLLTVRSADGLTSAQTRIQKL